MKHGYRPKYFKLEELVTPELFKEYAANPDYLWRKLNPQILEAADILREYYGKPITINTWHNGGPFKESGFAPNRVAGAKLSAHKFGLALDVKIQGANYDNVRADIKAGKLPKRFYECVNVVENNTATWLHIGYENTGKDGIMWVNP